MGEDPTTIRVFLSYAHKDDKALNFIGPFREKLGIFVEMKSRREVEFFLDRESLAWGDPWREKLSAAVSDSPLFIPFLTANYLKSEVCRQEFFDFHTKAVGVGASDLMLPVIPINSAIFEGGDEDDDVVRIARSLQWRSLHDGILSGYDSPAWLSLMESTADHLILAINRVETHLAQVGGDVAADSPETPTEGAPSVDGSDDDAPGLMEVMVEFQEVVPQMTDTADSLGHVIERLGEVAESLSDMPDNPTPKQVNIWLLNAARALSEPSNEIETLGQSLFFQTKRLDELVAQYHQTIAPTDDETREQLTSQMVEVTSSLGDMSETRNQIVGLIDSFREAEMYSAKIRKAMAPARRGLTKITDSIDILAGLAVHSAT